MPTENGTQPDLSAILGDGWEARLDAMVRESLHGSIARLGVERTCYLAALPVWNTRLVYQLYFPLGDASIEWVLKRTGNAGNDWVESKEILSRTCPHSWIQEFWMRGSSRKRVAPLLKELRKHDGLLRAAEALAARVVELPVQEYDINTAWAELVIAGKADLLGAFQTGLGRLSSRAREELGASETPRLIQVGVLIRAAGILGDYLTDEALCEAVRGAEEMLNGMYGEHHERSRNE